MIDHPYYIIDFSASACLFEIKVNDYPVINMEVKNQISTMIPINFAILESGKQYIEVTISPLSDSKNIDLSAELKFNLKLFNAKDDFIFQNQFGEYHSQISEEDRIAAISKYKSDFEAEVPYNLQSWQKGIVLKDDILMEKKLKEAYSHLTSLIKNKKFDDYLNSIAKRENNMAISMYLSASESLRRRKQLLKDFETGFEIMSLPDDAQIAFYGQGKVAMLKKPNGESALYLVNIETEEELMLDVAFYVPEGKTDFEII